MEDDTEEGEIRSDFDGEANSGQVGNEQSPTVEQVAPQNLESCMHKGHGEKQAAVGGSNTINADVGPSIIEIQKDNIINNNIDNNNLYESLGNRQEPNLIDPLLGPTPALLRKRTRDYRSPPSTESTQGPPNRPFCHRIEEEGHSFDPNSPSVPIQECGDDVVHGDQNPVPHEDVSQEFLVSPPGPPPFINPGSSTTFVQDPIPMRVNPDIIANEVEETLKVGSLVDCC
ncbi:hypothetical protein Hanom_Chr09g00792821 [Helianthus anomalus]